MSVGMGPASFRRAQATDACVFMLLEFLCTPLPLPDTRETRKASAELHRSPLAKPSAASSDGRTHRAGCFVSPAAHSSYTRRRRVNPRKTESQRFFQERNTPTSWQLGTPMGLAWRRAELGVCKFLSY